RRARERRRCNPRDDSTANHPPTVFSSLPTAYCLLPTAYCFSESLPEPNLKTEIIVLRPQRVDRALLILRDEREPVGDAVFEREHLILLGRHVGRIREQQVAVDLPPDRQTRRGTRAPAPRDQRIDLEAV